ncbi:pyridoxal phosphate phosphatase isoform X1 [Triplophysa dalaica]|uniref:pyridoxal phosphate phosphatase isoform X1 n=1 Tax=Triplophysa dalaica TaxID=1582913 RepID=UPI0024DFA34F|nr:pyridoxal phosphate phosphatase isoform X1 [Triplophysa dalaica]
MAGAAGGGSRGCVTLRGSQFRDLLDAKHNVLFDCDGVIWNGETAVTGAPEVVCLLKQRGKRVFFVTNNCTRPRESYVQKFSRLGFTDVAEEEIFSSAYCSAAYLRDVAKVQGKVYVIGCSGVVRELQDAGVHVVEEVGDDEPGTNISNCPLDPDVKAVLVGYDENFTFMKLAKACCYLKNSECLFLATDPDPWHPLRGGRITPEIRRSSIQQCSVRQRCFLFKRGQLPFSAGSGSLTAALETASSRKATVIGKPGRFMFECIASQFDLDPARSLMVGDRLETDILFGSNCGLSTMLTLTGVSTMEEAQKYKDSESPEHKGCVPDYVVESIADFLEALEE